MEEKEKTKDIHYGRANHILAHTYSWYFFILLFGVFLDLIFPISVFRSSLLAPIGFTFLSLATILILWAESTHHHRLHPSNATDKQAFHKGPYRFTRHPTHLGILFLFLGFGVLMNAFFVIVSILVSFILTKMTFLKKHDLIMIEKFGEPYKEYRKSVKF